MKHLTPVLCFAPPQIGSPLILPQQRLQPCSALPSRLHQESEQPSLIEPRKQAGLRPSMGRAMARPATKRSRAFLSNEAVSYYHNLHAGSEIWLVGVIHDARASSRVRSPRSRHSITIRPYVMIDYTTGFEEERYKTWPVRRVIESDELSVS